MKTFTNCEIKKQRVRLHTPKGETIYYTYYLKLLVMLQMSRNSGELVQWIMN